jgi:hypothetical protein
MESVVIAVLVLILLAILINYTPRISETQKIIIFVVLVVLVLLYLMRGMIL